MKRFIVATLVLAFLSTSLIAAECDDSGPRALPCETDVESPEFVSDPPTPSPSVAPTSTPTSSPSSSPTSAPSELPTERPTDSPTASPSLPPSTQPSTSPSIATASPSEIPSDSPSDVPSESPSGAPTDFVCSTQDGIYGDITAEAVTTIEFGYEVEANLTASAIESVILPLLEQAITDSVLSEVFPNCSLRRNLRVSRHLQVLGVSQNPEDLVLEDLACSEVAEGNECVVVSGALTLYSSDTEGNDDSADAIRTSIVNDMAEGSFDDVSDDVVRVSYRELQSDRENSVDGTDGAETIGDSNSPVLIGVLVAAGVVLAAGLAVAYKKRSEADGNATEFGEHSSMTPA